MLFSWIVGTQGSTSRTRSRVMVGKPVTSLSPGTCRAMGGGERWGDGYMVDKVGVVGDGGVA